MIRLDALARHSDLLRAACIAVTCLAAACEQGPASTTRTLAETESPPAQPAAAEPAPPAPNMAHQPAPCTDDWYAMVDRTLAISDEQGHGPDLGSGEWMSAVEHKLGAENMPEQGSEFWCKQVDGIVRNR